MREGYVFNLTRASGGRRIGWDRAGRIVAKIRAQAKVKLNVMAKTFKKKDRIYPAFGNSR